MLFCEVLKDLNVWIEKALDEMPTPAQNSVIHSIFADALDKKCDIRKV